MSFSPSASRIARSSVPARWWRPVTTSWKARAAESVQCQESSKASIWLSLAVPSGALNSTL